MAIIAQPPFTATVGQRFQQACGDGALGYIWDIPPGSLLPPGLELDQNNGTIQGAPTIPGTYRFYVREKNKATGVSNHVEVLLEVQNVGGLTNATIEQIVAQAFQLQKAFPNQGVWFEESVNDQGQRVLALMADDNGTPRAIASITI